MSEVASIGTCCAGSRLPVADEGGVVSSSLSSKLWNVDWCDLIPFEPEPGVVVTMAEWSDVAAFLRGHASELFRTPVGSPFMNDPMTPAKMRYLRDVCDCMIIRDRGEVVGVFVGEPADWSTYYIRMIAFHPRVQGRRFMNRFVPEIIDFLAGHGVERVEYDTSLTNVTVMHLALRGGFVHTGTVISERWGALARMTRFVSDSHREVFLDAFGGVPRRTK